MTKYVFDKIETRRKKTWIDARTGKRRQKTKVFSQTYNPFNRNKDGTVKSILQIRSEIEIEANLWMKSDSLE